MNELHPPAKLLTWIIGIFLALGSLGYIGKLTSHMAEAAIAAQQHDQMSWGKFSRQLWSPKTNN